MPKTKSVNSLRKGKQMPSLSNKKFEESLTNVVRLASDLKDSSRITMIHLMHAEDVNQTMRGVKSAMETQDAADLFMNMIAGKSINTKPCCRFLKSVVKNNMKEMKKLYKIKYAKDLVKYNHALSQELVKSLTDFESNL